MTDIQLYLWSGARELFLDRHNFYVEQLKARVLSQFDDLEAQADRYADEVYDRIGRNVGHGDVDLADIAEAAHDQAIEYYLSLTELRKQMLLGGVAGMFHQWDKELREFLERELRHYIHPDAVEKEVWNPPSEKLLEIFPQFGWEIAALPFFPKLEALGLVVNVYKHGKGRSLSALVELYPEYVADPVPGSSKVRERHFLDHDWLTVTDSQLDEFAEAIRSFWSTMPERCYYRSHG